MPYRAWNAMIAIALALLPLPAMRLLDHLNRGCGDGLCEFFSGLLVLGTLAVATLVFLVRSARYDETPGVLRIAPLLLWMLAFIPLFL